MDDQGRTLLVQDVTYYSKAALYDAFKAWRDGGPACSGRFDEKGAWKSTLTTRTTRYDQGGKKMTGVEKVFDTKVFERQRLGPGVVRRDKQRHGHVPAVLQARRGGTRGRVRRRTCPPRRSSMAQEFKLAGPGVPYTSPTGGAWGQPGPARGRSRSSSPTARLVTYSWYRFVDQPSFQQYAWSEEKKAKLQAFVEKDPRHLADRPGLHGAAPPREAGRRSIRPCS